MNTNRYPGSQFTTSSFFQRNEYQPTDLTVKANSSSSYKANSKTTCNALQRKQANQTIMTPTDENVTVTVINLFTIFPSIFVLVDYVFPHFGCISQTGSYRALKPLAPSKCFIEHVSFTHIHTSTFVPSSCFLANTHALMHTKANTG